MHLSDLMIHSRGIGGYMWCGSRDTMRFSRLSEIIIEHILKRYSRVFTERV